MDTLNGVVAQFNTASSHYAAAIQPFAVHLFLALLFIDVLVTALQFILDQGDAPHYVACLFRHILSGAFIYLMIVNAFPWMGFVLQSFSRVGTAVSGLPHLDPGTVLQAGGNMAQTIFDSPANASLLPDLELAIVQSVSAFFVLLSFVIAAAALTLTLIESYLVVGGAVLLLGFGGSRWTASIAEGYFGYVIKVGTRLLFFYLVLGIGMQIANQWQAAILAACAPISTPLPWYATYGVPPKAIMTTVCSNVVPVHAMLNLTAMSIVFLIVTLAVPYTAAAIVSGTVGLALSHAFEAAYLAQNITKIVNPITAGLKKVSDGLANLANAARDPVQNELGTIPNFVANQQPWNRTASAEGPTTILNPFIRKHSPSDNGIGPTTAARPALPSPATAPSNGGVPTPHSAPRNPGQYTKDIAIDVSEFQNGKGTRQ